MKHEGELVGQEWLERDPRIQVIYDVTVHGPAGGIEAELVNVSSAYWLFSRCRSKLLSDPLSASR